jgi:PAS domain S-box-containing protein
MIVFVGLIWITARLISRVDDHRQANEDALRLAHDELEHRVQERTAELAAERNRLRVLIDSLPDYIFVKDADLRFIATNTAHARAAHMTPEDMIGKRASEAFSDTLASRFEADDRAVIQSGKGLFNVERETVDEYGDPAWVLTTKVPLRAEDGTIVGLIGISRDITEHKQVESRQLELEVERERMALLKRFVRDVSHDFRTPLTIIFTSVDLLRKATDPQARERHLTKLEAQARQLHKLIEDTVTMTQLDGLAAKQDKREKHDINALIQRVCADQKAVVARKGHHLQLDLANNLPAVRLDPAEFIPAIRHLVVNALNYTPDGGTVTVSSTLIDHTAVIEVRDSGVGITPADLPHIFESFYRADQARGTQTGGAGLGLSIAKRIVEMHGGHIDVDSVVGEGSVFRLTLPVDDAK